MKSWVVNELRRMVSTTDSPTSRPPPDKRQHAMRSVVIQEPTKVGYHGVPMNQMTINEAIERYAPSPSSSANAERSSTSVTSSASRSTKPTPQPYFPQSDDVAGTVVTRNANRIWQVAPRLDERQFRDRQRVPPSSADQAQLKKLSIVAHVTRTLRAYDADKGETAWEQRVVQRLTTAHDNYLRPMMNDLHAQCARYSLQRGETWETHGQYPRSLKAIQPISKNALQRTRYCVIMDSIVPCDLPFDNLVPDVLVVTMPLSRLPEMAEVAIVMFSPELERSQRKPPPRMIIFSNLMDHMACEGQLQDLPRLLREMTTRDAARNEVSRLLHQIATAMERTAEKLRTQLGVPSLYVSPPGMLYWGGMFQQFVYMLSEVCKARSIEFYLCAPNLRVSKTDLRPAALSAHAYLAAISPLLQPVEKGGNAQLTWDDAVYYDHGMRLGTLTFDKNGNRTHPEATLKERENMRRYNWLVREEAHSNTIKADLAVVWDQIGRWPLNREIQSANNIEIIKMPLAVRHLVAQEAVTLNELVQAREVTYDDWYQDRLATVTLEMAARGLSASFPALLTSFGLGWHFDVIAAEFCLTDDQLKRLTDLLQRTTVNEVLALALALGPTKFVVGPLAILIDLTTTGGILDFYTYLVLAQGKLTSLIGFGELLFLQNGHNYTDHLFRMKASVQNWLYSTVIYASGLFVGVDQAPPLHRPDAQLPRENAGFPLP